MRRVAPATLVFSEASGEPTASWNPFMGHSEKNGDPPQASIVTPKSRPWTHPGPIDPAGKRDHGPVQPRPPHGRPLPRRNGRISGTASVHSSPGILQPCRGHGDTRARAGTVYGDTPLAAGLRRQRLMTTRPAPNRSVTRPISHSHVRNAPVKASGAAGTAAGGVAAGGAVAAGMPVVGWLEPPELVGGVAVGFVTTGVATT